VSGVAKVGLGRNPHLDCAALVAWAERCHSLFEGFPGSGSLDFNPERDGEDEKEDRYAILPAQHMPPELRQLVEHGLQLAPGHRVYYQLNRYQAGDYVLPHRDRCHQSIHILTRSPADGLTVEATDGTLRRVLDEPGLTIVHAPEVWHWVDPVLHGPRYTLVTIPPVLPRGGEATRHPAAE
jgi:hypothetical protein